MRTSDSAFKFLYGWNYHYSYDPPEKFSFCSLFPRIIFSLFMWFYLGLINFFAFTTLFVFGKYPHFFCPHNLNNFGYGKFGRWGQLMHDESDVEDIRWLTIKDKFVLRPIYLVFPAFFYFLIWLFGWKECLVYLGIFILLLLSICLALFLIILSIVAFIKIKNSKSLLVEYLKAKKEKICWTVPIIRD